VHVGLLATPEAISRKNVPVPPQRSQGLYGMLTPYDAVMIRKKLGGGRLALSTDIVISSECQQTSVSFGNRP
jgi:hypothetical protein